MADMTTDKYIRTFIEDLLNEIIATANETALKEKTAIGAIEENTTTHENTAIEKETEINSAVKEIVEGLLLSTCQSWAGGGDAPEGSSAPTVIIDDIDTETTSTEAVDEDGSQKL